MLATHRHLVTAPIRSISLIFRNVRRLGLFEARLYFGLQFGLPFLLVRVLMALC